MSPEPAETDERVAFGEQIAARSRPGYLAVIGRLRGMQPTDADQARVLELGCGNSTVFDTTMPTMKITPSSDCTLMAVPVTHSISTTPTMPIGTAAKTTIGVMYDLKSATIRK